MFNSNGVKLFFKDEGTGQPVVLVHGYLANHDNQWFKPKIAQALLAKGYRVVALDSRGHGQSEKPLGEENYGAEMSEDVVRLLEHLRIAKAHVVGYSMGSWVVQKLAADHPGLVHTLTVGGAGWLTLVEQQAVNLLADQLDRLASGDPNAGTFLKGKIGKLDLPTVPNEARALRDAGRGVGKLSVSEPEARAYPGPMLGLIGADDTFKPSMDALHKLQPAMELVVVDGDHLSAYEQVAFVRKLEQFLGAHPVPKK